MRWRGERESSNVEDRRGMSGGGRIAIGGGLGTPQRDILERNDVHEV